MRPERWSLGAGRWALGVALGASVTTKLLFCLLAPRGRIKWILRRLKMQQVSCAKKEELVIQINGAFKKKHLLIWC